MSGSKSKTPKAAAQPKKALLSGDQPQQAVGGGGGGNEIDMPDVIEIDLVKVSPIVWNSSEEGNPVDIVKQNGEFEVLLSGKRLGCIPPDYDDTLASRSSYRGRIKRRSEKPIGIRIQITLS
jgi:hypothetical protein